MSDRRLSKADVVAMLDDFAGLAMQAIVIARPTMADGMYNTRENAVGPQYAREVGETAYRIAISMVRARQAIVLDARFEQALEGLQGGE